MDLERIPTLLHIVEKCRGLPELKPIHDEAMDELRLFAKDSLERAKAAQPESKPQPVQIDSSVKLHAVDAEMARQREEEARQKALDDREKALNDAQTQQPVERRI